MLFNLIWEVIWRWKNTAVTTFRVLDAWRDDPGVYFEYQARYKGIYGAFVRKFISGTATLIQEAKNLSIDPRPIQAFSDAVDSWHHQHNADRVPDQGRLSAMLEAALATVQEIEDGIRQREVKGRPIQVAKPITPVAMNGRMHMGNGAHPIVPMPKVEAPRRQPRLSVKLDASPPYIIFDGTPLSAPEASVRYLAALIKANGYPVAFNRWVKDHPEFERQVSTRVVKAIPEPVRALIDCPGKGSSARLKVEELDAQ